jgi:hypothetical protein
MGQKCYWVESGPVGSAQLAQWARPSLPSGRSPPVLPGLDLEVKVARWALHGRRWATYGPFRPVWICCLEGWYAGRCSAAWRALRSRAGEPSGGDDAAGLEPGLTRVKDKQTWGFPPPSRTHTHTHTGAQRSSEQQAEAHGRLPRARRAASLRRVRARARRSGSALGCAWQGHNSAREYLQEKGWLGAKTGVRQRRVAGARLTLALGCARAQPPPSPSFAAQNTTAQRAVHRNPRHDATRGTQHGDAA